MKKFQLYTIKEIARALGVHTNTVRNKVKENQEKFSYSGERKRYYSERELEKILKLF